MEIHSSPPSEMELTTIPTKSLHLTTQITSTGQGTSPASNEATHSSSVINHCHHRPDQTVENTMCSLGGHKGDTENNIAKYQVQISDIKGNNIQVPTTLNEAEGASASIRMANLNHSLPQSDGFLKQTMQSEEILHNRIVKRSSDINKEDLLQRENGANALCNSQKLNHVIKHSDRIDMCQGKDDKQSVLLACSEKEEERDQVSLQSNGTLVKEDVRNREQNRIDETQSNGNPRLAQNECEMGTTDADVENSDYSEHTPMLDKGLEQNVCVTDAEIVKANRQTHNPALKSPSNETNSDNEFASWPYSCKKCSQTFSLKKQLEKHKTLPCKKTTQCCYCDKVFARSNHISRHVKAMHKDKVKEFFLDKLGTIQNPIKIKTQRTFKCKYCFKEWPSTKEAREHEKDHECDSQPFLCTECGSNFSNSLELKSHRLIHIPLDEEPFKCQLCNFTTRDSRVKSKHDKFHSGEKPYPCTKCEKAFHSRSALKNHDFSHTGEKPFSCEVCGRAFHNQEHLKRHQMIHSGAKPYECHICKMRFNQTSSMKAHIRSHLGDKPFICQECGHGFITSSNLKVHLRKHYGERPHTCRFCEKSFARSDTLAKHVRTHTGEKPFVCNICGKAYSRSDKLTAHERSHTNQSSPNERKTPKKREPGNPVMVANVQIDVSGQQRSLPEKGSLIAMLPQSMEQEPYPAITNVLSYTDIMSYKTSYDYHVTPGVAQPGIDVTASPVRMDSVSVTVGVAEETYKPVVETNLPVVETQVKVDMSKKHQQFEREYCRAMDTAFKEKVPNEPDGECPDTNVNESIAENNKGEDVQRETLPDPIDPNEIKQEVEEFSRDIENDSLQHNEDKSSDTLGLKLDVDCGERVEAEHKNANNRQLRIRIRSEKKKKGNQDRKRKSTQLVKCSLCDAQFSWKYQLAKHIQKCHAIRNNRKRAKQKKIDLECPTCKEAFKCRSLLKSHLLTHKKSTHEHKCKQCRCVFSTSEELQMHQKTHKKTKNHNCKTCDEAFDTGDDLKLHKCSAIVVFKCRFCSMAFNSKDEGQLHEKETHKNEHSDKPFVCLICEENFPEKLQLVIHNRKHKGEKPFMCEVCKRKFRHNSALLKHAQTHTAGAKVTCDICKETFLNMAHLKRHSLIHTGEKPYVCDICKMSFNQSSTLKVHMRRHTGAKPYVCETCGTSFRSISNLHTHQRKHSGVKLHQCSFCEKKFARSDTLTNHERIHKGEKPFICSVCALAFSRKDKMKLHEKKHFASPDGITLVKTRKSKPRLKLASEVTLPCLSAEIVGAHLDSSLAAQLCPNQIPASPHVKDVCPSAVSLYSAPSQLSLPPTPSSYQPSPSPGPSIHSQLQPMDHIPSVQMLQTSIPQSYQSSPSPVAFQLSPSLLPSSTQSLNTPQIYPSTSNNSYQPTVAELLAYDPSVSPAPSSQPPSQVLLQSPATSYEPSTPCPSPSIQSSPSPALSLHPQASPSPATSYQHSPDCPPSTLIPLASAQQFTPSPCATSMSYLLTNTSPAPVPSPTPQPIGISKLTFESRQQIQDLMHVLKPKMAM